MTVSDSMTFNERTRTRYRALSDRNENLARAVLPHVLATIPNAYLATAWNEAVWWNDDGRAVWANGFSFESDAELVSISTRGFDDYSARGGMVEFSGGPGRRFGPRYDRDGFEPASARVSAAKDPAAIARDLIRRVLGPARANVRRAIERAHELAAREDVIRETVRALGLELNRSDRPDADRYDRGEIGQSYRANGPGPLGTVHIGGDGRVTFERIYSMPAGLAARVLDVIRQHAEPEPGA